MIRKILLILTVVIFITSGCINKKNSTDLYKSALKNQQIIVGVSLDAKPFAFKDTDGQIKGIEVDLAKEITRRMLGENAKTIFKNIIPQDRIKAVKTGEVDMVISTMTINSERKKLVSFSEPYFVAGQVICVKKDSRIDSLYDLINKRVIVTLGTTGEENIKKFAPNALIQSFYDNDEALKAFKDGEGDAIITDDSLLIGFVMENPDYKLLPKRLTKEPYGIAFNKAKQAHFFRNNVNKIISEMQTDGTLRRIKYKWGVS